MQDVQIDQKYTVALKAMNYTVEQALRDFLILHLSGRIAAFKSECEAFERKYGMNFQAMPELHWEWGYFFALGLMALSSLSVLTFMKWKKWF